MSRRKHLRRRGKHTCYCGLPTCAVAVPSPMSRHVVAEPRTYSQSDVSLLNHVGLGPIGAPLVLLIVRTPNESLMQRLRTKPPTTTLISVKNDIAPTHCMSLMYVGWSTRGPCTQSPIACLKPMAHVHLDEPKNLGHIATCRAHGV